MNAGHWYAEIYSIGLHAKKNCKFTSSANSTILPIKDSIQSVIRLLPGMTDNLEWHPVHTACLVLCRSPHISHGYFWLSPVNSSLPAWPTSQQMNRLSSPFLYLQVNINVTKISQCSVGFERAHCIYQNSSKTNSLNHQRTWPTYECQVMRYSGGDWLLVSVSVLPTPTQQKGLRVSHIQEIMPIMYLREVGNSLGSQFVSFVTGWRSLNHCAKNCVNYSWQKSIMWRCNKYSRTLTLSLKPGQPIRS